jgi:peptide/nickel transport system substrate-binding protein
VPALRAQAAQVPPAGTLRIGIGVIPANPDPAFDTTALSQFVYNQTFDALAVADERGHLKPALATSWKVLEDKVTWQFKLRQGVKFHNGEEFDAEAVKFNIERHADPKTRSSWFARVAQVARVDVVDKYTVNVVTRRPWAILLKDLLVIFMVPPKYYQQVGMDGFSRAPAGTGPFRFKAFDKLSHFTLGAAETSWHGAPKVAEVVLRRLPEPATRVAALESGEVDVAVDVPVEDVDRLKGKGILFKGVNIAGPNLLILRTTVDSPLKDRRIRQAMNYAVDKEAIVRHILRGYGRVLDGQMVGPDGYGYNPALKPYPYDVERARKILAEAGYPNGFEIKFEGTEGRYPKDKEFEEAIVGQMAKAGIRLNLQIVDANVFIKNYVNGILGPVFIIGQQYLPSMDLNQGLPNFRSAASHKQLASKEFDALYEAQAGELDPEKRLKLLHQVSAWVREEAPVVFLHQYQTLFGMYPSVKGFEPQANFNADLAKVTLTKP